jgi:predicted ATPase/DNA-binding winged helix-turn-helix (wHTH) protein
VTKIYEIGPFRLDPAAGVLSHGGQPMALGLRAVAVLTALVKQPNEYVRKESILDAAWSGVVVEEGNLPVQILAIRRALAQAPGGEHWVETLPRRGYRFVGPVAVVDDSAAQLGGERRIRSNLPVPLTSFIGRERELVEVKRLLPGKRLLTITGVGGIGKTRLALQVASEVTEAYDDGVWLVELASITDPTLVPTSVAQVLGVQEKGTTPLTQTLCAHLKARQLLLILDNCEHVLPACTTLASTVLSSAAEPTILATSREPLHVAGEQTYALRTLSLPDPSATLETIGRSEAVQLFVERAQRQVPDFALTAARVPAVAKICTHLDGIPLALELAAARIRSLSVEQINMRLYDRFNLLTSKTGTALPRQQTLRATLDWSFDLLGAQERAVLQRLAVFAGGFTLEAASSVASDETIDEFVVIDLLAQLVERSLVVADTTDDGARYRLLETTRSYALEKLAETGETDGIKCRHAQYFRARLERASDEQLRMSQVGWRAIYLPELDNVRAALDWALGAGGNPAIGIALAGAAAPLWTMLSPMEEAVRRLEVALAQVARETPASDQARLWHSLGLVLGTSAPVRAVEASERATSLYRSLGDATGLGLSLLRLGRMRVFMGRFADAEPVFAEAWPSLERTGLPRVRAAYHRELGSLKMLTGDLASARTHFEKALTLFRDAGAESSALAMLLNLGDMTRALGDLDGALARFREAVTLMRTSPLLTRDLLGHCLTNLAGVYTERGELAEALAAAREGLPLKEAGTGWGELDYLALRAALVGKVADAARLAGYEDAAFAAKQTPRQPNEMRARARLQTLLREKLVPDELERLLAEGAKMTGDEACRLALEE